MLNPNDTLRQLILANTGNDSSPYSWSAAPPGQLVMIPQNYDSLGPFSPGRNTGNFSAGMPRSDYRNDPDIIF